MNLVDFERMIDEINLVIKKFCISIDDIIISSHNFYYRHTFTDAGNRIHELRSLSKYIVALCYGRLLCDDKSDRRFDFDTPIWPILLPKIKSYNKDLVSYIDKISVKNLLIQSAGYNDSKLLMSNYTDIKPDLYLEWIASKPVDFLPGSRFVYSNVAYFLLSAFYQELYGESIHAYAKKHIFDPLEISESKWSNFGKYCAGATGLSMHSEDFHKIAQLSINSGEYNGLQVIPSNYIKEMLTGKISVPYSYNSSFFVPEQYGYSFWCARNSIKYISGANGQYIIVDELKQICITILSNAPSIVEVLKVVCFWLNKYYNDI